MNVTKQQINSVFLVLSTLILIEADERLIVSTSYGKLLGKFMKSREGRTFAAFLGVPYAAPPTGPLRFMPPRRPQAWEVIRKATKEGNVCIQREMSGEEDCLYLNVFSHLNKSSLLPVMVYIHGGGFYGGSCSIDTYGPEYFMDRNIVLVSIQYRLGVFGFLSTEDDVVPGNMGLKDQVSALRWVQENIMEFGGDPSKVTIFGNSAGSASVHLHMISSASKNLYSRAISQSGTAFSAFAVIRKGSSRGITRQLAQNLNCPDNSTKEIIQCIKNQSSADIQKTYSNLQDSSYDIRKVLFRPVVEEVSEHAFLTSSPYNSSTDKPWLMGFNTNEGLFKINYSKINETINLILNEFSKFGPAVLFFEDTSLNLENITELIYNYYFKKAKTTNEMIIALEQVISDSWFFWPSIQAIDRHNGTLYCYWFDHEGEHSYTQVKGGPEGFGVSHMDELHYLFSQTKIFPMNMSSEDTNISRLLVNLWVNFAEQINPTPYPVSRNPQSNGTDTVVWKESNKLQPSYLHIETNKLSIVNSVFEERIHFWKTIPNGEKLYF